MTAPARYPNTPGYKTDGASLEAAVAMRAKAPSIRQRVLVDVTAHGPSTPTQIAARIGVTFLSVRPRCTELLRDGKLIKSTVTQASPHGGTEHFYALPEADIPPPSKPAPVRRKRISEMTVSEAKSAANKAMDRYTEACERAEMLRRQGRDDSSANKEAKRHLSTYRECMDHVAALRKFNDLFSSEGAS